MDLLELHHRGTVGIVTRRVARSPDVVDLVLGMVLIVGGVTLVSTAG